MMLKQDTAAIDAFITHDMQTNADYLRQVAVYLTERQEPPLHLKILLLSLKMTNYQGQAHIQSAVIFEYIFAATKLHDDTMEQKISCQNEVLNQGLKGKDSRILVGDFFYSRAYSLMANLGKMKVVSHLTNAINQYTEGQTLQICQAGDGKTSEQQYFQRLKRKSCLYYTSVAQVVGELGDCTHSQTQALCDYALHVGMAAQIIEETLGCIRSSVADQHKQSNLPFMVIRGLQQANPALRQLIQTKLIQTGVEKQPIATEVITQICAQTDALAYTHAKVKMEIKKATQAVQAFPESVYRQALIYLATGLLVQFDTDFVCLGGGGLKPRNSKPFNPPH
jgi:octaprenyl-diphosphate synthase